jgi:hypothetical protein
VITGLFAEIGGYLILAAIAFLGTLGYGIKKKQDGKKEAVNESAGDALEKVIKANEIDDEVDALESSDAKRELFDKYGKE